MAQSGVLRNLGSNYKSGFTHQGDADLGPTTLNLAQFHSLWVGKAGAELQRKQKVMGRLPSVSVRPKGRSRPRVYRFHPLAAKGGYVTRSITSSHGRAESEARRGRDSSRARRHSVCLQGRIPAIRKDAKKGVIDCLARRGRAPSLPMCANMYREASLPTTRQDPTSTDLPVQQSTSVNIEAANALGLAVPHRLRRARRQYPIGPPYGFWQRVLNSESGGLCVLQCQQPN